MIVLYTSSGCGSCRKAKQWFKDKNIKYIIIKKLITLMLVIYIKFKRIIKLNVVYYM